MNWLDCIGNRKPVEALFSKPPDLKAVRVLEITLRQDGPCASVSIELNEMPDKLPERWVTNRHNRAQLRLMFIEVKKLTIRGWKLDNIVDINIEKSGDGIALEMKGQGTAVDATFSFVEIEKVSGYRVNEH